VRPFYHRIVQCSVDRQGYPLEDINTAMNKHTSCVDDVTIISSKEQKKVLDELESQQQVLDTLNFTRKLL